MVLRGTIFSTLLSMDTQLTIVGRNKLKKNERYKVVYLLHPLGADSTGWVDNTMLAAYAHRYNILFIMPDASKSFYTKMKYGPDYFNYVSRELPEICKTVFNISTEREDTAIIGGSMGGYGALKCALSKPEQYGFCAGISSACLFLNEMLEEHRKRQGAKAAGSIFDQQLGDAFTAVFGDELQAKPEDELLELAKAVANQATKPRIYLSCGTEDFLHASNRRFAQELDRLGLDVSFRSQTGGHDWFYFNEALIQVVEQFHSIVNTSSR